MGISPQPSGQVTASPARSRSRIRFDRPVQRLQGASRHNVPRTTATSCLPAGLAVSAGLGGQDPLMTPACRGSGTFEAFHPSGGVPCALRPAASRGCSIHWRISTLGVHAGRRRCAGTSPGGDWQPYRGGDHRSASASASQGPAPSRPRSRRARRPRRSHLACSSGYLPFRRKAWRSASVMPGPMTAYAAPSMDSASTTSGTGPRRWLQARTRFPRRLSAPRRGTGRRGPARSCGVTFGHVSSSDFCVHQICRTSPVSWLGMHRTIGVGRHKAHAGHGPQQHHSRRARPPSFGLKGRYTGIQQPAWRAADAAGCVSQPVPLSTGMDAPAEANSGHMAAAP